MATATIPLKGSASMESKKVSISSKRQITIPQKFFTLLGFNTEAECIMRGNRDIAVKNYLRNLNRHSEKSVRQLKQCLPKQTGSQNLNQEDTP